MTNDPKTKKTTMHFRLKSIFIWSQKPLKNPIYVHFHQFSYLNLFYYLLKNTYSLKFPSKTYNTRIFTYS